MLRQLSGIDAGRLTIIDRLGASEFGSRNAGEPMATITVHDLRCYGAVVWGGALGAAESFIRGDWDADDLTAALCILGRNSQVLANFENGSARLLRPLRRAGNWLRRNTHAGSKRNIAAHYDLGNEFFALMLDPTMTYSSGVFPSDSSTLQEASIEKYDRICRKLQLAPRDHVLEIGAGWGGLAEHAARHYGCRVTTTTISSEQHAYATRRIRAASLENRVTILGDDYRDLNGQYDKLVSIEMIEAVGERFLPGYFAKCAELLKRDGMMLLQSITMPDDRYQRYRRSVDFIQHYIFPGGFLPSPSSLTSSLASSTDLRCFHWEEFGPHYARTIAHWRRNFMQRLDSVKALGFDERFVRAWRYYLAYCEAAFAQRQVGVAQILLARPDCRRAPIL